MQASKWLTAQALISGDEMEDLLNHLENPPLYLTGSATPPGQGILTNEEFLTAYRSYIKSLSDGTLPLPQSYQPFFSPAMSATSEALYTINVGDGRQLIRVCKPVIQMQAHTIDYSPVDKKFRSMVFGAESIPWGIQFSYPQIFLNTRDQQVIQTKSQTDYPNSALFAQLQKWMRQHTIPTPFLVEAVQQNVPMRLGKGCFPWINRHPQLVAKGIQVKIP